MNAWHPIHRCPSTQLFPCVPRMGLRRCPQNGAKEVAPVSGLLPPPQIPRAQVGPTGHSPVSPQSPSQYSSGTFPPSGFLGGNCSLSSVQWDAQRSSRDRGPTIQPPQGSAGVGAGTLCCLEEPLPAQGLPSHPVLPLLSSRCRHSPPVQLWFQPSPRADSTRHPEEHTFITRGPEAQ